MKINIFRSSKFAHMVRVIRTVFRRFSSSGFAAHPCRKSFYSIKTLFVNDSSITAIFKRSSVFEFESMGVWLYNDALCLVDQWASIFRGSLWQRHTQLCSNGQMSISTTIEVTTVIRGWMEKSRKTRIEIKQLISKLE